MLLVTCCLLLAVCCLRSAEPKCSLDVFDLLRGVVSPYLYRLVLFVVVHSRTRCVFVFVDFLIVPIAFQCLLVCRKLSIDV